MSDPNLNLLINGSAIGLGGAVEYEVTVTHGRNDISSTPQASDATVTLYGFTGGIPAAIGDTLVIEAYGGPRFTGFVVDLQLTHLSSDTPIGRLTIQAIGMLSRLGLSYVGESGYPQDDLTDRIDDILTETGYVYTNNSRPLMELISLDAVDGGYSALDLLSDLGTATGATFTDLPDGAILWESYTRRGYGYNPAMWQDLTTTWAATPYVWSDVYEATEAAATVVELPATAVVWAPVWRNTASTIVNRITVTYGTGNSSLMEESTDSIAEHGLRATTLNTSLHGVTDATTRAEELIRSQAWPLWALQNIQVLVHTLSAPILNEVLGILQGYRVDLESLPYPHPITDYLGICEGWSETYTPGQHVLTLSLSDPRFSYEVAQWGQTDPTLAWSAVNVGVQWYNVVLPSDLEAA